MMCVVCRKQPIDTQGAGRRTSSTCGLPCSHIRNTVDTDEAAYKKWQKIHVYDVAVNKFLYGMNK